MFETFSNGSRRVMVLCADEARALGHNVIAPHHIALGLLRYEEGTPGLFAGLGVNPSSVNLRQEIIREMPTQVPTGVADASVPFTSESKRVLELSLREALRLGHKSITPGHLLLALLSKRTPKVLARMVDLDAVQAAVRDDYAANPPDLPWRPARAGRFRRRRSTEMELAPGLRGTMKSDDLLITLITRKESLGGKILAELGVTEEKVRELAEKLGEQETLAENEIRVGDQVIKVDDPWSRDMLRKILDDDPDLAERIRVAIERRATGGDN